MKKIVFEDDSLDEYSDWARENIKTFDKVRNLLKATQRNNFKGIGKPEPLKHYLKGCWSRRIDDKHWLIYRVSNEAIHIISCKGHYD